MQAPIVRPYGGRRRLKVRERAARAVAGGVVHGWPVIAGNRFLKD